MAVTKIGYLQFTVEIGQPPTLETVAGPLLKDKQIASAIEASVLLEICHDEQT